eukprot:EG_transcript_19581
MLLGEKPVGEHGRCCDFSDAVSLGLWEELERVRAGSLFALCGDAQPSSFWSFLQWAEGKFYTKHAWMHSRKPQPPQQNFHSWSFCFAYFLPNWFKPTPKTHLQSAKLFF